MATFRAGAPFELHLPLEVRGRNGRAWCGSCETWEGPLGRRPLFVLKLSFVSVALAAVNAIVAT